MENGVYTDQTKNETLEFNRFGIISFVILIIGCLGGLAIGLGAVEHVLTIAAVVIPTMTTLSLLLAVSPVRLILISAAVTALIDIIFILFYSIS